MLIEKGIYICIGTLINIDEGDGIGKLILDFVVHAVGWGNGSIILWSILRN